MIDLAELKQIYNFTKTLTLSDVNVLIKTSKKKTFEKKEKLITLNSDTNEVFFVRKGLVRAYMINEKGEEITIALYPENSVVTNADFLLFNDTSRYSYEAYEKTKTLSISYEVFENIMNKDPKLAQNKHQFFLRYIKSMFRRIESFVLLQPEERYLQYIKQYPDLANRVPDKFIANILGITPVSLSRIRNRLSQK